MPEIMETNTFSMVFRKVTSIVSPRGVKWFLVAKLTCNVTYQTLMKPPAVIQLFMSYVLVQWELYILVFGCKRA